MTRAIFIAAAMLIISACSDKDIDVSIATYLNDRKAAVSFTYDDGINEHYTLVAPHLESIGIRGTFWIIGSAVKRNESDPGSGISWAQIREMSDRGHEMSNHTWTHSRLTLMSDDEVRAELKTADDTIEAHTGKRPLTVAVPFNDFDDRILNICYEDHIACRTYQTGQGQGRAFGMGNRYSTLDGMKEWLDKTICNGEWGVTMTHGITVGWDTWENPQDYWDFIEYAGTRSDEVWYGTFGQVAAYKAESEACEISFTRRGHTLTVTPRCGLDSSRYTQPLTLRVVYDGKIIHQNFDPFGGPFTIRLKL